MQHFGGYNPAALGAMYTMHQQALQMQAGYRPSTHALSLAERLAGELVETIVNYFIIFQSINAHYRR